MKTLLTISTLVFTVMFSSPSFAGWTAAFKGNSGDIYYVDFERIRKHGGYVYFWVLQDYAKTSGEFLSYTTYLKGDCSLFRFKTVTDSLYRKPMGMGPRVTENYPDSEWSYPPPNRSTEIILKHVCSR
jgi:hypothetical protein